MLNDEPILVAADIEDHSVVADEIGRPIVATHV